MKSFLLPLAAIVLSGHVAAQSTHACKVEAYLADTSTGKSNVRNAPNGKVIITLNNKAPAVVVVEGQPTPAPVIVTKKVTIVGQNGEWFQISKTVTDTSVAGTSTLPRFPKPTQDLAFVHKSIIAVRSKDSSVGIPVYVEPSNRDANIKTNAGLLTMNQEVKISGCANEYAQVTASNGAIGYTHAQFLAAEKAEVVATETTGTEKGFFYHPQTGDLTEKSFEGEKASEVTAEDCPWCNN
jgi:hypothetical protein